MRSVSNSAKAELQWHMRNSVTFRHPAEFIRVSEEEGILSITGADWFISLLRRVDGLVVHTDMCQEDWGIVVFAERDGKRFWIGLSMWPEGEQAWLAHFHHHSFAWIQRFSVAGKLAYERLISDFHSVLESEPAIRDVEWYHERELNKAHAPGSATPDGV